MSGVSSSLILYNIAVYVWRESLEILPSFFYVGFSCTY